MQNFTPKTVTEHLANPNRSKVSFEILPPVKGSSIQTIYDTLDQLMEFVPPYINITYHREETTEIRKPDGTVTSAKLRKRPGTVSISTAIQAKYGVDVVPHLICGGFSRYETEDALIDLDFLGIKNLLVLRGDSDKSEGRFIPHPEGHSNAVDIVRQVANMNKGVYLEDYVKDATPTNFCVGVAGYPEKHLEAPCMDTDLKYLKEKVDAGAEYIVTQLFFNNELFYTFRDRCREAGINVPIVPGIKPLTVKNHLKILPEVFGVAIPDELRNEVEKTDDKEAIREIGAQWAIQQAKDLLKNDAPIIHVYTMGRAETICRIAREL